MGPPEEGDHVPVGFWWPRSPPVGCAATTQSPQKHVCMASALEPIPDRIELPTGLMAGASWISQTSAGTTLNLIVPADYEARIAGAVGQSEVLGIQRILTLARRGVRFLVAWEEGFAKRVTAGASIFPLLAVLLLMRNSSHKVVLGKGGSNELPLERIRRGILSHRLARDFFSDSDTVICADGAGGALPVDLYDTATLKLHGREDFETLVVDALLAQVGSSSRSAAIYSRANALGVVLAELFENTDMHGRLDGAGRPLGEDSLRGLIFKRVKVEVPVLRPPRGAAQTRILECFEASVFDAGIGYFASYTHGALSEATPLEEEWKVLHNCLERHYYPELLDNRAGHRALGLYEVLRGLQSLHGRIEVRTGRLFAYRTFLDGELQAKMKPRAAYSHFAWPVPKLLDVEKKYRAQPSEHEFLVGSSVRIIVPLTEV